MKKGQAEIDILPLSEDCDSMSILFEEHPENFRLFAKNDFDVLMEAYGGQINQRWDLTDPTKKKFIK